MTSASGMPDALAALAADPAGTRLGLTLPPGRLVSAYPDDEGPAGPPVYWLSDVEPTPGTWARLRARHGGCGLWPLLLGGLSGDERRPWQDGEVSRAELSDPATLDPDRVLAEWWAGSTDVSEERSDADPANLVELGESTEPYPRWPGLAEPGRPPEAAPDADPAATTAADTLADAVADDLLSHARRHGLCGVRLGLVPAARGSDALAATGWEGPINLDADTGRFAAVVRSWEERFGVRVIAIGFDVLYLSVAAPPTTVEHALHVAAEHFAFCPDNVWQGTGSLRDYAHQVVGANIWGFWWD